MLFKNSLKLMLAIVSLPCFAILDWSTPEGVQRLERAKDKTHFFLLAPHFEGQKNRINCGPTSLTILLNSYRPEKVPVDTAAYPADARKYLAADFVPEIARYTQNTVFETSRPLRKTRLQVFGEPIEVKNGEPKKDWGLQLHQLEDFAKALGFDADKTVVTDSMTVDAVRSKLTKALKNSHSRVLVNFLRKSFEQPGGGHISPVSAYDASSDSFLVMDVNPSVGPFFWATATELTAAMKTLDTIENRGFVVVSKK